MRQYLAAACLGLAAASALPAQAQQASTSDGWTFTIAPYIWGTGLNGTVGVRGHDVKVDESFSDILQNLDFAFMGVAEARRGRFGLFTDIFYADLSTKQDRALPGRSVKVIAKTTMWTVGAEYRLAETPKGSVDVLGGVRAYWLDSELQFSGGLLGGRSFEDSRSWADPIIGFKGNYSITPRTYLTGWLMVGGGVNSDSLWDVMGAVGYHFTDSVAGLFGYRATGVDYTDGDFKYDITQQGLLAGVAFNF